MTDDPQVLTRQLMRGRWSRVLNGPLPIFLGVADPWMGDRLKHVASVCCCITPIDRMPQILLAKEKRCSYLNDPLISRFCECLATHQNPEAR